MIQEYQKNELFFRFFRNRHTIHTKKCKTIHKIEELNKLKIPRELCHKITQYIIPLKCSGNCGRIIQCSCMCQMQGINYRHSGLFYWVECKKCENVTCNQCFEWTGFSKEYSGGKEFVSVSGCSFCLIDRKLRLFKCPDNNYDCSEFDIIDCIFTNGEYNINFDDDNKNLFLHKFDQKIRNKIVEAMLEQAFTIQKCCESKSHNHMIEIFPEKLTELEIDTRKNRGIIYG